MNYPDHNIDPKSKDKGWLLTYARKCWEEWRGSSPAIFYNNAAEYQIEKDYALGQQDITRYKKPYRDEDGKSYLDLAGLRVRPIISKIRDIAISRLQQRDFNIVATPIDQRAKGDEDKYFADVKVKILMRDMMKKQNPEMLEAPVLVKQPGEPEDLEELEMQMTYTWKHNMAIEAELIFQLIAYQNDFTEERRKTIINLYDHGVGGYKEYIDSNSRVRIRAIDPQNMVVSYCRRPDFRDATHMGEVIEVNLADLTTYFTTEELSEIRSTARTDVHSNPSIRPANIETRSKVDVLDMECYSWDDFTFGASVNDKGDLEYGPKSYMSKEDGDTTRKVKRIYAFKWIIGTEYIYDYGLATNQKRTKSAPSETNFSYHLYAYNFYNMQASGFMKRLIPGLDEYMDTVIKIRHFKEKWLPYIIDIDMEALENVALGKNQQLMQPKQLLDMMFQTNVLLSRRKEISSGNINYKAVDVQPTPMAQEFSVLVADLQRVLQELDDMSGFNALTDGSTPNAKTLVPVANMANQSTNNALYPVTYAEKHLLERMAKGVIQREQLQVKNNRGTQGVVHALGSNTLKFLKASPDFPLHEFGIMIEDRPQEPEKLALLQEMNLKDSQGLVDPDLWVMIMNSTNLKVAQQQLAYKIKKKREADQANAMQAQQQNAEVQMQAGQAVEKSKQETLTLEYQLKSQLEIQLKQMDMQMLQMKLKSAEDISDNTGAAKLIAQGVQNKSDKDKAKIQAGIPVVDDEQGMSDMLDQMPEAMGGAGMGMEQPPMGQPPMMQPPMGMPPGGGQEGVEVANGDPQAMMQSEQGLPPA